MTKHNPTPWQVGEDGTDVFTTEEEPRLIGRVPSPSDSALIVRAVNEYEADQSDLIRHNVEEGR